MKNSKCAISKLFNKNGRSSRCGKLNKKREHAETEQRRRSKNVNDIRQNATGCAPPKEWRIEPDPEEDVNPELLNVPRKHLLAESVVNLSEFRVFIIVRPSKSIFGMF